MPAYEQPELTARIEALAATVVDEGSFDPARPLAESGFDSIAYAELALALEADLGVRLGDADLLRLRTIGEIASAVQRLQSGRPGPRIPEGIARRQSLAGKVAGPVLTRWYQVRIVGAEHVPSSGPAVVSANHNSLLDIPFLAMAVPRDIVFMAKVELFKGIGRPLFHTLGGFPVHRQINDLKAVDTALAVLERGGLLGMFPEGTRSPEQLLPFLPGAAWVALVRGAPIVPVAISGAAESLPRGQKIPKRTRVSVRFGEPIPVEREDDPRWRAARAAEITAALRRSVEGLLEANELP
jgi:1-acyl-sn-glycerol-3-phosphate acyltransferase